jgi:hypothetical protein
LKYCYFFHMPQAALRKIDCHVLLIGDGGSGRDFPVAVSGFGPWRLGLISRETWRQSRHQQNQLFNDAEVMCAYAPVTRQSDRVMDGGIPAPAISPRHPVPPANH